MSDNLHRQCGDADKTFAELWEHAERLAAENERLGAAFDRIDSAHQPTTVEEWTPCPDHRTTLVPGMKNCPMCAHRPARVCSNTTCCGWPCRDHLALWGETREACSHG